MRPDPFQSLETGRTLDEPGGPVQVTLPTEDKLRLLRDDDLRLLREEDPRLLFDDDDRLLRLLDAEDDGLRELEEDLRELSDDLRELDDELRELFDDLRELEDDLRELFDDLRELCDEPDLDEEDRAPAPSGAVENSAFATGSLPDVAVDLSAVLIAITALLIF